MSDIDDFWQPISTAPLDDTYVDLWLDKDDGICSLRVTDAFFRAGQWRRWGSDDKGCFAMVLLPAGFHPTHWMKQPLGPKEDAQ